MKKNSSQMNKNSSQMKKDNKQKPNRQTLMKQNSSINLDIRQIKQNGKRHTRQMNSVSKLIQSQKKQSIGLQDQINIGLYKYKIKDLIGSGYSSKVYKCSNSTNNYAIKVIELSKFKSSSYILLQNQISIMKRLHHPNIIQQQNIYKTSTNLYIVMEICEKGDLLQYIMRNGRLREKQAMNIMADLIKGLQYLFAKTILHRDLKPGNILFDGQRWKIADFGFAIESVNEIKTKNNVGTPLYMPLQSLQDNLYSPQSDIFALGIILYELLFGVTPWQCRNQQELIQKLQKYPLKFPQKIKVSQKTKALLKKMCSNDKSLRMTRKQFNQLDLQYFYNFKEISQKQAQSYEQDFQKQRKSNKRSNNQINIFKNGKIRRSADNPQNINKPQLIRVLSVEKIKNNKNIVQRSQQILKQNIHENKQNFNYKNQETKDKQNRQILLYLLNLCRFMYYFMKNVQILAINQINKQKLRLILIRNAILTLKLLVQQNKNWFNLQNYMNFTKTKNYSKLKKSFEQYLTKYAQEERVLTRKLDFVIVTQINEKLPQTCQNIPQLNRVILNLISPILRQNNHNLATQIISVKKKLSDQLRLKIQGIKTFFKYFKIIESLSKDHVDYQSFSKEDYVQVRKVYNCSNSTVQQFMDMRKLIKYI